VRGDVLGEIGIAEPWTRADEPFPVKAGEALFDIRGILGAALLAVIDDVQADGDLLLHDLGHPGADTLSKDMLVERTAFLPEAQ
jgi:hypothetical protein